MDELDRNQEIEIPRIITASDYKDLEVLQIIEGRVDRPVGGVTEPLDGWNGYKMYLGISSEMQRRLLGENAKPSDYIVALLPGRYDPNVPDLYVLSQAAPDEFIAGKFMRGEYNNANPYAQYGIKSEDFRRITEENPSTDNSIASPFFADQKGTEINAAILDLKKMQEFSKPLTTILEVQNLQSYPERLKRQWEAEREAEGRTDLPIVVLPNAVVKALGLIETRAKNTQQPEALGGTVAKGKVCTLIVDEFIKREVFVCGGLDRFGLSNEIVQFFDLKNISHVRVEFSVGSKCLVMKSNDEVLEGLRKKRKEIQEVI